MSDEHAVAEMPGPPALDPIGARHGLRLRHWRADDERDVAAVLAGVSDPEFLRWNTMPQPILDEAAVVAFIHRRAQAWRLGSAVSFCVTAANDDTPIGQIGLHAIDRAGCSATVGYWVLPEARGRGVATGSLDMITSWAFATLPLHRIDLKHAAGHDASCAVAERCGFAHEGTLRGAMLAAAPARGFRDAHLHARLATDPRPDLLPEPSEGGGS
ncbi:GNAT family N-acetyltransferase [Streptomyces sp. NPDC049040]|uniref:GNAT family N-acetyltransferase n=1 Tax=Streptomyces sp. NPDC049040 TaxID=3365593 RepID=UPI00371A69F6